MAMALLVLPMLAFVAAQDGAMQDGSSTTQLAASGGQQLLERRRAVNGTELVLECPPAAHLVRTHMAPDFEHPQLVRRLDWVHDSTLVASFQQDAGSDFPGTGQQQQWWVRSGRFELRRPFFELRIAPLLPQDSGEWHCRLDTDPLFAAELPLRTGTHLLVLLRPPVPPKPVVLRHTDHSVTLDWAKFTSSPAHQPILRFSILVVQPEESSSNSGGGGSMRVLATGDNQTWAEVGGLRPNTRYAFSVRAENAVGESAFGAETLFRTIGLPPKKSPQIRSLRNGTTPDCIDVEWDVPEADQEPTPLVGFRIMVHRLGTGAMREWYVKGGRARAQPLCALEPHADYVLTVEADNGFGYSAGTTAPFRTDQGIPDGPPEQIQCRPLPGGSSLELNWRQPLVPNGVVRAFFINFKEVPSQRAPGKIRLEVSADEALKAFAFNLTKLAPNTRYKLRLSAATVKGEGPESEALFVDTDFAAPNEPPKVSNLSYGCDSGLLSLEWTAPALPLGADGIYRIAAHSSMAEAVRNFNISAVSPHKLLLDQVQPGEQLSISVQQLLKSRADPALLLPSPLSPHAHFALISNGWRCRFRSSACPPAAALPAASICEHFPEAAAAQQGAALLGQQQAGNAGDGAKVVDANMPFIFLVFGATITLAISLLFGCMLRRHCLSFKSVLRRADQKQQQKRGPKGSGKWKSGAESTSLVRKTKEETECSVVLPPITLPVTNGHCQRDVNEESVTNAPKCCELAEPGVRTGPTVSVLEFDAYFEEMTADGNAGFRRQFQEIELETALLLEHDEDNEDGQQESSELEDGQNGMEKGEKTKDRYVDVGALPKRSRIRLLDAHGRKQRYINANFVDSCDQRRAYIATQAPLPHTFGDFWSMCWQERCRVLVALTNMVESGRRKCDQYWPDRVGGQLQADQFVVTLTGERTNSVFTHRVLQLSRVGANGKGSQQEEARTLHQLHFMAWPDHGVPDSPFPLLHFVNYVADIQCSPLAGANTEADQQQPCVVHCSAGVGRSGAFILIDSLRQHLLHCDRLDICGQLRRMRRQRAQLVQTLEQFVFCHEVLRHLVANGISRQPRSHFPNYCRFLFAKCTPAGQPRIQAQFHELLACRHLPVCTPMGKCIPLAGYHRTDEFLFCGLPSPPEPEQLWTTIWEAKCQSLAVLDSRPAFNIEVLKELLPRSPLTCEKRHFRDANANVKESPEKITIQRISPTQVVIRSGTSGEELLVAVHRMGTAALLADPWVEIERLQTALGEQHRGKMALLELYSSCRTRPSAAPFLFCALQSAACQLEQESAVDVLLWLASYKHAVCGCWTDLAEIELIYRRVLELVEMQRALC